MSKKVTLKLHESCTKVTSIPSFYGANLSNLALWRSQFSKKGDKAMLSVPQKLYGEIELYVSGTALLRWWHSYLVAVAMQCCCGSNAVPDE